MPHGVAYNKSARQSSGWARIAQLVMESEKRQNDRVDRVVGEIKRDLEPRLRAVENAQAANAEEHREVRDRLEAQKGALGELQKGQETIKDALIFGRALAWLIQKLRGK